MAGCKFHHKKLIVFHAATLHLVIVGKHLKGLTTNSPLQTQVVFFCQQICWNIRKSDGFFTSSPIFEVNIPPNFLKQNHLEKEHKYLDLLLMEINASFAKLHDLSLKLTTSLSPNKRLGKGDVPVSFLGRPYF